MHLHDYIIVSQNKQDNSSLCTILDYHLACSDHDERVPKVGPTLKITELEAKSKGKHHKLLHPPWSLESVHHLLLAGDV